jgi:D-amino peptidase
MNILVLTDLEGISGVDSMEMVSERGSPGYRIACERLMLDLNAAVEGVIEGGAEHVYAVDCHAGGKNFIKEMLDPRAIQLFDNWWDIFKTNEIDACMKIGAHSMAGTINGFLDHTLNSKAYYNYIVNGRRTGEIGQNAIFAGVYNVPLIMVSGDEAACVEAKSFLGDIKCAVVKYGIGRNHAHLISLDEALDKIKKAAHDSLELIGKIPPYKPLLPLEIKLELYRSDMCDELVKKCKNVERLDARTLRKVVTKIESYRDILF